MRGNENGRGKASIKCAWNTSFVINADGHSDSMLSFGDNSDGELGIGDSDLEEQWKPTQIAYFKENSVCVAKAECGFCHILALSVAGDLFGWGRNEEGQCGQGTDAKEKYSAPMKIDVNGKVTDIGYT